MKKTLYKISKDNYPFITKDLNYNEGEVFRYKKADIVVQETFHAKSFDGMNRENFGYVKGYFSACGKYFIEGVCGDIHQLKSVEFVN